MAEHAHVHHAFGSLEGQSGLGPVVGSFGDSKASPSHYPHRCRDICVWKAPIDPFVAPSSAQGLLMMREAMEGSRVTPMAKPPGSHRLGFGAPSLGGTSPGGGKSQAPELSEPHVQTFMECLRDPDCAIAVAAIQALTTVIQNSTASTVMELQTELDNAASTLRKCNPTAISLRAGCELFLRYVTRTSALGFRDLSRTKDKLIERGRSFASISHQVTAAARQQSTRPCFAPPIPPLEL